MVRMFICATCNVLFYHPRPDRTYCSRQCREATGRRLDRPRQNTVTIRCHICKQPFITTVHGAKERKTCSKECGKAWKSRRRQIAVERRYGKPIKGVLSDLYYEQHHGIKAIARILCMSDRTVWDWFGDLGIPRRDRSTAVALQWTDNKRKETQRKRASEQMRQRVNQPGYQCPSKRPDVAMKISQAKMGQGNAMFGKFGEQNPNWRGGKITYRGKGWRGIRAQILRRDNCTCAKCGERFGRLDLDVHHITPYRETQNNDFENLMTLCKWCHAIVEYHFSPPTAS